MTPDTYMTAQECLSVAALTLAGWFCIRARHLEAREQVARTEVRAVKRQLGQVEMRAMKAEQKLWWIDRRRSSAASHARQCQLTQQRARKLETTQRLERVAARKKGVANG